MVRAVDVIRKKRDGEELSAAEIDWMVDGIARGDVADYQWSALLMAIVLRGMDRSETVALADAMMRSGLVVDLSSIAGAKVDKHSTGGVGDKTSLVLAPIAAAAGVLVPMVSGRGLGHAGGTLDKLESIPGFRVDATLDRYREILRETGLVLIGQTAEIAPADKFLYALRDATSTVESVPLIAASIMSKKLAEGIDGLVLDVKFGNGAYLPDLADARRLAETMCDVGRSMGKKVVALITRMDQPLGLAVGNAVEVAESIACLKGEGPDDLTGLSLDLAAEMVKLAGLAGTIEEARGICERTIQDGSALERFRRVIAVQGGDARVVDDPELLPQPRRKVELKADRPGWISRLDARPIGEASMLLGAGRVRVDSAIDPAVGVILHKKLGDRVEPGEPLCTLLVDDEAELDRAREMIEGAYHLGEAGVEVPALIVDRLIAGGE
ncbi:thymidine phosphorylase [Planctomyces sp. SH-PL62]|uniref:thymidine phosphorylase n=1 Tax=Planctomyces sp. SH-PL62 TaxID=1636152 RepID=UPI00078BCC2A|nr:thymidine phosphorylase [Planctomyces sp. SH-PL62]AMV39639.1 Pyrimidine-nucleoside phosphorylase [Planctomyces sp. SH-PL62]